MTLAGIGAAAPFVGAVAGAVGMATLGAFYYNHWDDIVQANAMGEADTALAYQAGGEAIASLISQAIDDVGSAMSQAAQSAEQFFQNVVPTQQQIDDWVNGLGNILAGDSGLTDDAQNAISNMTNAINDYLNQPNSDPGTGWPTDPATGLPFNPFSPGGNPLQGPTPSRSPPPELPNFGPCAPPPPHYEPLVLNLTGSATLTSAVNAGAYFDYNNNGFRQATGWAAPGQGILVYDPSGGNITNGRATPAKDINGARNLSR